MIKWYREYKLSLKDIAVEEVVDLIFFRPLAFIIVKLIYRLPVTPNQISVLSIMAGITSGVFFAMGSAADFMYAGLFLALSHTLDCCDGMIARLKKNGTITGRILDGFADYTSATAVFVGMNIGIYEAGLEYFIPSWILLAGSALSMIIHSIAVDYYKSEFLAHGLGVSNSTQADRELFSGELEKLKGTKGRYFDRLLMWLYLGYSRIQIFRGKEKKEYDQKTYYRSNRMLLRLWNWLGSPTHIFFIVISAILFKPEIFFYFSLVAANIWMTALLIIQARVNKKIAKIAADE
ncbi:MAG: CDP-alcohol phosphatidyltransferase family protein [Candidatus Aminicenantes bacterium]|nr:CDP-alcohol phosphatidyltransferase family protein [Candidatus Aminicenantes bacterium]